MNDASQDQSRNLQTGADDSLPMSTRRVLWLSTAALASLVLIALFAMFLVSREIEAGRVSNEQLSRTRDVLEEMQLVLSSLTDAETGERGYVITGEEEFLAPYNGARASLPLRMEQLAGRIEDEEMRRMYAELERRATDYLAFIDQVIALRRYEGEGAAAALIASGVGKVQMDTIRELADRMHRREQFLLDSRGRETQLRSQRAERSVLAGISLAMVLVIIAGLILVRHLRARLAAENAAQAAYSVLRSTLDSVNQGVLVLDEERRLVAWNDRFVTLRGLQSLRLAPGMRLAEISPSAESLTTTMTSDAHPGESLFQMVMEGRSFDIERARSNGTVLQIRGRAMSNLRYIVTYTDVTALKQSELAYRDQATRLSAILDNIVDAIITMNESGSIESWSKGAERLFGYTSDEVLRRNISMLMPEPHSSGHDGYIRRYIATGERRIMGVRRELEAQHKDGYRVPIDLGVSEMKIGKRRLFIGVVRDISDRREIERLKSGFVSTVSHELRTPLTSISGSLGLIAGGVAGELTPKAKRLVDIAKVNCERLVRLINDILDLEKAESGRLDFHLEPQMLKPIVEHVVEAMRSFGEQYKVRVELLPTPHDPQVLVDRDRLIQVLTNLVSNACKFSPPGSSVELEIRAKDDMTQVLVRDHGPGIPREFRPRMFQRFAQADSSDSRAKGGTGLGLSIARTITERLGGNISFETSDGEGTTFYVSLPVRAGQLEAAEPIATHHQGAAVLVCEDDPDVATVLCQLLRKEGMRADSVGTARGAKTALASQRYDLALIDLHLPDMEGLDLIAELRAEPATRTLPMIVITAGQSRGREAESVQTLHLADWLQKPIDPQRLLRSIQHSIAKQTTGRARVLHIEDDVPLTLLVRELLNDEADVVAAHSIGEAQQCIDGRAFDLIILDVTLADGSGLEVLPMLKNSDGGKPPVILYSATEPSREITQLVQGALVKSRDSVEQLLERVRSLTHRAAPKKTSSTAG